MRPGRARAQEEARSSDRSSGRLGGLRRGGQGALAGTSTEEARDRRERRERDRADHERGPYRGHGADDRGGDGGDGEHRGDHASRWDRQTDEVVAALDEREAREPPAAAEDER